MSSAKRVIEDFASGIGKGYRLVWSSEPAKADYPIGMIGASPHAQLCRDGRTIEATDPIDGLYSIAHEIAHGEIGFDSEFEVMQEQARIVTALARLLLCEERANAP